MPLQYITKVCPRCNNPFTIPLSNQHQIHCSRECVSLPLADKFWPKVHKTESCWIWTAAQGPNGYGEFNHQKKHMQAHRVSWALHFGAIPAGLRVLHRCDNRLCVRPDHLFLGTAKDNTTDMLQKEREARGKMLPQAKLTAADIPIIRTSSDSGDVLAARYGVSKSTISMIRHRKVWKHIP